MYPTNEPLELATLESGLQRSSSPEFQESSSSEIESVSEPIMASGRRISRRKDVSSSYSSLIPKSRDRIATFSNETITVSSSKQMASNIKSDTVSFSIRFTNNY